MNKYHNWPDTCAKFSPKNSILLLQTHIFLSILNMKNLPEYIIETLILSATQRICVTQNFQKHKYLAIPKPNQNHTTNSYILVLVWFWSRTSIKNEPKTNQKRTKNRWKRLQRVRTIVFILFANVCLIFGTFLVRFWFVFDAGSASKSKPKPKYTTLCYRAVCYFF